jgi:hypothetical protein
MSKNTIILKIYKNKELFIKDYEIDINMKIIELKNMILKDIFNNQFNDILFENITSRVYKDYGKLFFDIGVLPNTIDNYKLSQFTNANREFLFIVNGNNKEQEPDKIYTKKIIKEEKKYNSRNDSRNDSRNNFIYCDNDFPPLK